MPDVEKTLNWADGVALVATPVGWHVALDLSPRTRDGYPDLRYSPRVVIKRLDDLLHEVEDAEDRMRLGHECKIGIHPFRQVFASESTLQTLREEIAALALKGDQLVAALLVPAPTLRAGSSPLPADWPTPASRSNESSPLAEAEQRRHNITELDARRSGPLSPQWVYFTTRRGDRLLNSLRALPEVALVRDIADFGQEQGPDDLPHDRIGLCIEAPSPALARELGWQIMQLAACVVTPRIRGVTML